MSTDSITSETTFEDIKRVLWAGADTFRGVIDAANYKEYVLSMLFIKYLDDTFAENVEGLVKKYAGNELRVSRAGQKAGAFFTPVMVSELMARLVAPKNGETVYDPTCGSASLLIRAAKQASDLEKVGIYGQEVNGSTYAMARMNLFVHNIHGADIQWGDTLARPLHLDADGNLKHFDTIVANMPFSLDKWAEGFNPGGEQATGKDRKFKMSPSLDPWHRFEIGVPPAGKGDWAFLLHMLASLDEYGRMAAVVPHGVLFRGASEGAIRKEVVCDKNWLDTVIGLPANLFYGTSIPACILLFRKNRTTRDVLFIDASGKDENGVLRFEKGKNQNKLTEKHIEDILRAVAERKDVSRFAHVASPDELERNGWNLNIPRYVDTFEEEAPIDFVAVQADIAKIKCEVDAAEAELDKYLKELGLA